MWLAHMHCNLLVRILCSLAMAMQIAYTNIYYNFIEHKCDIKNIMHLAETSQHLTLNPSYNGLLCLRSQEEW